MKHLLLAVALSVSVLAQDQVQPGTPAVRTYPDVVVPPRVGISITQHKLTLDDAVQMALKNNLDIQIERTVRDTAEEAVQAARGFFDPSFRWVPLYNLLNTPAASVLQSPTGTLTDRRFSSDFYLQQVLPQYGTQFQAGFTNSRITTNNPFTSLTPNVGTSVFFNFTQPLWRGFRTDPQRAEIRIRQKQANVSALDFENRVIDVVTQVKNAYWNLAATRAGVEVSREQAAQAREQLAINERMVKAGTLAPVELAAAEAELERRLDTLYASVELVTQAENTLKTLLAPDRTADIWRDELVPEDVGQVEPPPVDDVRAAVSGALDRRPELRSLTVRQEINDVQKELAKEQQKPQINLVAQYSLNGLAGTEITGPNPLSASNAALYERVNQLSGGAGLPPLDQPSFGGPPAYLVGGWGSSLSNLFGGRYQSFQAGISLDLNLRNRTANANLAQAVIGERRLRLERERLGQLVEAQVRNSMQSIDSSRQRINAARTSVRAATEKLESEVRLYQTGESTNFLVLTRQNELADSRRRLIVATLDFNRSVAQLNQALGTVLAENKITLDQK
jgi:HAE1 family hydrophobic/amphiphilic exporter-1